MHDNDALLSRVREFLRHEVDDDDRRELESLIESGSLAALQDRFSGMSRKCASPNPSYNRSRSAKVRQGTTDFF